MSDETERLKRELAEARAIAEASMEFADFGLWDYSIADDLFRSYKGILNNIVEKPGEPVSRIREAISKQGCVFSEDLPEFNLFCDTLKKGSEENAACEIRMISGESETYYIRLEARLVRGEDGEPAKYIGRTVDVTGERTVGGELSDKRDPLTGAYTLSAFKKITEENRKGANRYGNAALFSVGIDRYREICGKSGTDYANYLQKTTAKILTGISVCERGSYTAKSRDGEFLLYTTFDEMSSVDKLAKRILHTVKSYIFDGEPCTVSVGLSVFKSTKRFEEVYAEAEAALSEAKRSGGGCYMSYAPAMSMGRGKTALNIDAELDVSELSGEASKVYALILKAFRGKSEDETQLYLKEAFKTAGGLLNAAAIYVYTDDDGTLIKNHVYSADENSPELIITCPPSGLKKLFKNGRLRVQSGGLDGIELSNGGALAECRTIGGNKITEFFAVVYNSGYELKAGNIRLIDELQNSAARLRAEHFGNISEQAMSRLRRTIFTDHRIEAFSIVPGEYKAELVETNTAENHGLKAGDICYKKIYGRDAPCEGCPVKNLENGELYASNAMYVPEERRWLDVAASIESNDKGERRFHVSAADITECLGRVKISDTLTGLMTFDSFTAEALRITSEEKYERRFAVVMNIADFRRINDEKGFETGNSILIAVAEILRGCTGSGELLCRSEGSRFIMLFKNSSVEECTARLNLIMTSIQKQVLQKLKITIYLVAGAYDMESDEAGVTGGIDRAIRAQKTIRDKVYYHDNMLAFFDQALRDKIKERRYIEANMTGALENNEFQVFYQPKISIETGKVVGAEALARWIRPGGEVIAPSKFVPIFEANGFITDMDFAVYRKSIADIKRWLREGIEVPLISINVSRHHLGDDSFCEKLNSLVDTLGVPHKYIELEITESLLTDNIDKLIEMVRWFKDRGYRISVDDFGSGYSSLNLITMLPFDTLKIDGGFFLKNDLTEKNRKVITSVVTLAKSLNLETVSEGVETQLQVDFLKELGCDMIQGFFYYKPMPCKEFEEILRTQNAQALSKSS